MHITERRIGDATLLTLSGRLVFDDGDDEVRTHVSRLIDEGRVRIILDLQHVSYMDSCGVGVLISRFVSARRRGGDIGLLNPSPRCLHVMQISQLLGVFQVFESEDQALADAGARRVP